MGIASFNNNFWKFLFGVEIINQRVKSKKHFCLFGIKIIVGCSCCFKYKATARMSLYLKFP